MNRRRRPRSLEARLLPGERLLWFGRPAREPANGSKHSLEAAGALVFGGAAAFVLHAAGPSPGLLALGAALVLAAAAASTARPMVDATLGAALRRRFTYGITDRRVLRLCAGLPVLDRATDLADLDGFDVAPVGETTADLVLRGRKGPGRTWRLSRVPAFEEVVEVLERARQAAERRADEGAHRQAREDAPALCDWEGDQPVRLRPPLSVSRLLRPEEQLLWVDRPRLLPHDNAHDPDPVIDGRLVAGVALILSVAAIVAAHPTLRWPVVIGIVFLWGFFGRVLFGWFERPPAARHHTALALTSQRVLVVEDGPHPRVRAWSLLLLTPLGADGWQREGREILLWKGKLPARRSNRGRGMLEEPEVFRTLDDVTPTKPVEAMLEAARGAAWFGQPRLDARLDPLLVDFDDVLRPGEALVWAGWEGVRGGQQPTGRALLTAGCLGSLVLAPFIWIMVVVGLMAAEFKLLGAPRAGDFPVFFGVATVAALALPLLSALARRSSWSEPRLNVLTDERVLRWGPDRPDRCEAIPLEAFDRWEVAPGAIGFRDLVLKDGSEEGQPGEIFRLAGLDAPEVVAGLLQAVRRLRLGPAAPDPEAGS